jgi:hypothetical protein
MVDRAAGPTAKELPAGKTGSPFRKFRQQQQRHDSGNGSPSATAGSVAAAAQSRWRPSVSGIICEEFTPRISAALRGFARVRTPGGLIFHDVCVFQQGDRRWATPSSKPQIAADGTVIKRAGKTQYAPVIAFASRELREKFSSAVVAAVRSVRPEAFES